MSFIPVLCLVVAIPALYGCYDTSELTDNKAIPKQTSPESLFPLDTDNSVSPTSDNQTSLDHTDVDTSVIFYTYEIINTYIHDQDAFTQGLAFENGVLYEGTGHHGKSNLRKIDVATGKILQMYKLADQYFGEGITVYKDNIIQLTWKARTGFVYDKHSFDLLYTFQYQTEGWGITHDGKRLIISDGSSTLFFLNPEDYSVIGNVDVYDGDTAIDRLNELEYINGQIYANVWFTDKIAIINPETGQITGWIDLKELLPEEDYGKPVDVLNGIAYDSENNRLFVTGKFWPILFEIEVIPLN